MNLLNVDVSNHVIENIHFIDTRKITGNKEGQWLSIGIAHDRSEPDFIKDFAKRLYQKIAQWQGILDFNKFEEELENIMKSVPDLFEIVKGIGVVSCQVDKIQCIAYKDYVIGVFKENLLTKAYQNSKEVTQFIPNDKLNLLHTNHLLDEDFYDNRGSIINITPSIASTENSKNLGVALLEQGQYLGAKKALKNIKRTDSEIKALLELATIQEKLYNTKKFLSKKKNKQGSKTLWEAKKRLEKINTDDLPIHFFTNLEKKIEEIETKHKNVIIPPKPIVIPSFNKKQILSIIGLIFLISFSFIAFLYIQSLFQQPNTDNGKNFTKTNLFNKYMDYGKDALIADEFPLALTYFDSALIVKNRDSMALAQKNIALNKFENYIHTLIQNKKCEEANSNLDLFKSFSTPNETLINDVEECTNTSINTTIITPPTPISPPVSPIPKENPNLTQYNQLIAKGNQLLGESKSNLENNPLAPRQALSAFQEAAQFDINKTTTQQKIKETQDLINTKYKTYMESGKVAFDSANQILYSDFKKTMKLLNTSIEKIKIAQQLKPNDDVSKKELQKVKKFKMVLEDDVVH